MSELLQWRVLAGTYCDSVVLMQLQKALSGLEGVVDAGVVMATAANRELLMAGGLWPAGAGQVKADDLLVVIKANDEALAMTALNQVEPLLQQRRTATSQAFQPRSLHTAVKQLPAAKWVMVSVPGRYAAGVARQALELDRHLFLYSNNVSLEDEVRLKELAVQKGLLVMGPDCGTAIINGVGLGFANRVRRGNIGLVAASGTGLQTVSSTIHNLGGGISQAIGTGGRDLSLAVAGRTTLQALQWLADDPQTQVIGLVSKPPAAEVAARLLGLAHRVGKPVVVNFIGYPPPAGQIGNLFFANSLAHAGQLAVELSGRSVDRQAAPLTEGFVRGLFSGGTLAYEVTLGLQPFLLPLYSNAPAGNALPIGDLTHSQAHTILDMGADQFTQGRLHPMLDFDLRLRRLGQEWADPQTGLVLLDVVLGEGSHPDPAGQLIPLLTRLKGQRDLAMAVIVIGTADDPQNKSDQVARLQAAGAIVFEQPTAAVEWALASLRPGSELTSLKINLGHSFAAVNVGLESFYESVVQQGAKGIQVAWRPPAGGNENLSAILARLKGQ